MSAESQEKARLALEKAQDALLKKDANEAFKYAKTAVALNQKLEEAWLILASVSNPKDSVEFLNRALEINPNSQKARKGMRWAASRLRKIQQQDTHGKSKTPQKHIPKKKSNEKVR